MSDMSDMKQNQTTWQTTKNLAIASIGGAALLKKEIQNETDE